jgi:D-threonate/D-erythronate kinase
MRVRLLADDLTGAIDSAVRFVPRAGPFPVVWDPAKAVGQDSVALDLGTREGSDAVAAARVAAAAPLLAGADVAYLKCDSLLRGHLAVELLACLRAGGFARAILAPAFPAQRRVTRNGRQYLATGGQEDRVGPDVAAQLRALGCAVAQCRPGDPAPSGISIWDAATEADLHRIVAGAAGMPGATLWCGSAGLAAALGGGETEALTIVRRPILALAGSDHPVTAGQLALTGDWHCPVGPDDAAAPARLAARLAQQGGAAVSVILPPGHPRDDAAAQIAATFARLLDALPPPATLFATGGETLRSVCEAVGATALTVRGEFAPGVPVSALVGGRWNGVTVISKSGAFGEEALLHRLLNSAV